MTRSSEEITTGAVRGTTRREKVRVDAATERDLIFILADRQRGFPFRRNRAFFARYLIQAENRIRGSAARARSSTKRAGQLINQSGCDEW